MSTAPKTAQLLGFLVDLQDKSGSLMSMGAQVALREDIEFMEIALEVLRAGQPDDINELWRRVQSLSRFFGGDYLPRGLYNNWSDLCEAFKTEVFEAVVVARKQ